MKYLIVLASVFGFGLCELFPQAFVHNIPASQFPHYLTMAKAQLHGLKATDDIFVAKVTVQGPLDLDVLEYAGVLRKSSLNQVTWNSWSTPLINQTGAAYSYTKIDLYINHHPCTIKYDDHYRSHTVTHSVRTNTCTAVLSAGKRQLGGIPENVNGV